jgi:hypothetical protein
MVGNFFQAIWRHLSEYIIFLFSLYTFEIVRIIIIVTIIISSSSSSRNNNKDNQ